MRENICKLYIQEAINIQNIYIEKNRVYVCVYIYTHTQNSPNSTTTTKSNNPIQKWIPGDPVAKTLCFHSRGMQV